MTLDNDMVSIELPNYLAGGAHRLSVASEEGCFA